MAKVLPFPRTRDRTYELREAQARREIEDSMPLWALVTTMLFVFRGPVVAKRFLDRKVSGVCRYYDVDGPIF